MDLRWWPVLIAGIGCLAVGAGLALLLPMGQVRRQLRPLANVGRLTRLPEYVRMVRLRSASAIVTVVLLAVVFGAAVVAGARPLGLSSGGLDAAHSEDIMLCVGDSVTDPATGTFLDYFARHAPAYDTERIGLTSRTVRVVPLTRDYQYAAGRFGDYAELAQIQADIDANKSVAPAALAGMHNRVDAFSPPVSYVDYAPSVQDVLALCMTGFPSFEDKSSHRRSLIYLGPSGIRSPQERRPSLFTAQQITDMAAQGGIQVNAVTPAVGGTTAPTSDTTLRLITESSGGQYMPYRDTGALAAALDTIRNKPPRVVAGGGAGTAASPDAPTTVLVAALAACVLLSAFVAVARR